MLGKRFAALLEAENVAQQSQRLGEVEVGVEQIVGAPEADELADRGAQVLRARRRLARVGDHEPEHRARVGGLARGAGVLRDLQRGLRAPARLLEAAQRPQRERLHAEQPRTPGAVALGQQPQRLLVGGQAAVVLERAQPPERQ